MLQTNTQSGRRLSWLGRILPPARCRAVPWSPAEVVLGFVLVQLLLPMLAVSLLHASGFYSWLYGPDLLEKVAEQAVTPEVVQARNRLMMWAHLLALPFQAGGLLWLLSAASGTRPYQLGLTRHRAWQNVALGVVGAILLTPIVLGVNYLASWAFERWMGGQVQQHPLFALRHVLRWYEWFPLLLQVLVCAPVAEELICRGLIQRWLCQHRWGGHAAIVLSLSLALGARDEVRLAATLFVIALLPLYALVVWRSRTPAGPAIFGTALLFGMLHAAVWPTPIALFVLGLGLGWLAWRTQSLVGPIVLHSLFNAVGSLHFLFP